MTVIAELEWKRSPMLAETEGEATFREKLILDDKGKLVSCWGKLGGGTEPSRQPISEWFKTWIEIKKYYGGRVTLKLSKVYEKKLKLQILAEGL